MGKKIDYFVLTAGIAVAFYLYIRSAVENRLLALGLSLLCCAVINRTFKRIYRSITSTSYAKNRQLRKKAAGALMHLACMQAEECHDRLDGLTELIYSKRYTSELIQRHPAAIGISDIFSLWKKHQGCEKLVIFTTGHADEACFTLTAELKDPQIALLDANAISQMIARHPDGMFPEGEKCIRTRFALRHLAAIMINRKNAPKCLTMFISMMVIYIFSANILYLLCALFLLGIALVSLRRRNSPIKLF